MKKFLLFAALSLLSAVAFAQTKPAAPEKSDPEAKKLLDKVRKKYEGFKTMEAAFSLTVEVPGEDKTVQKGSIAQAGEKFRLDMDEQVIISDGKSTWVWQKKSNEVQINNAETGDNSDFLTPRELLRRYQKGDFLYAITEKASEGGKLLTLVEFKPKDKKSEYSKIRVGIDAKAQTIETIKAFAKDGSRYTFKITRLSPNKQLGDAHFTFDKNKFPGARIEDLRM